MSQELDQALGAWVQACHDCVELADQPPSSPPAERKKPDDTEGGTCD